MDLCHATSIAAVPVLMRIKFLTRSLSYGGSKRQLVAIAKGLRERGAPATWPHFIREGLLGGNLSRPECPSSRLKNVRDRMCWGFPAITPIGASDSASDLTRVPCDGEHSYGSA